MSLLGLVGDVGGTHARFAVARQIDGRIALDAVAMLRAADFTTAYDALHAYLDGLDKVERPKAAVIAAAGPIEDDAVEFTNNPSWRMSGAELGAAGGLARARLINDFTAQALAIDHLQPADLARIGPDSPAPPWGTAAILGPGTGFGAAARIDDGESRAVLTSEGGHVGFAPADAVEIEIVRRLGERFGRVSIERLLSGPGLLNLYQTLAEIGDLPAPFDQPEDITTQGLAGDRLARMTLERFGAMLGSVAGDFVLAYGARQGAYISGGIAPRALDILLAGDFRRRFEAKGRMGDYLKRVPTFVVVQPAAALIGAADLLLPRRGAR
jgi:glucokinase